MSSLSLRPWLSWKSYGISFLLWSLMGAFIIGQRYLFSLTAGIGYDLPAAALAVLPSMWTWALLSPLILQFAHWLPMDRGHLGRNLALHVLLAVGCLAVDAAADVGVALFAPIGPKLSPLSRVLSRAFINLYSYAAVLAVGYALDFYALLSQKRLRAAELEKQLVKAQLDALQMQLRPHFLFNSLHTVAGLVRSGQGATAVRLLAGLGELLRKVLKGDGEQLVPLRDELDFIERYLEIERVRFDQRLRTKIVVAAEALDALVPSLIIQPLVENALRHGIESKTGIGEVDVQVARERDRLWIRVRDSSSGAPSDAAGTEGAGVALANTRQRLRHLYGEEHRFDLIATETGGAMAVLAIPFQLATPKGRAA